MRTPERLQALAEIDAAICRLQSIDDSLLTPSGVREKYRAELRYKELRREAYWRSPDRLPPARSCPATRFATELKWLDALASAYRRTAPHYCIEYSAARSG